jgi:Family of unknown function (DUF5309)
MADVNVRSFNSFITEQSNVRDVSTRMLLLDQNRTALYQLTAQAQRKVKVYSPRIEFFEDADLVMLGVVSNGTTVVTSTATTIPVGDITLFGVADVVVSENDEHLLVTAIAGSTNGTLTVTRGFAGSTANTMGATATLKILGSAQTENGTINNPRSPVKTAQTSGCQIFEWPIQLTRTAASTRIYGDKPERARLQELGMRRQKLEIENAGLYGRFSESLSSPGSRYTSMGVRNRIATNITNVASTLTYQTFLGFSRLSFRYGAAEKLLLAAPIVKEGLDFIAGNKQLVKSVETQFGVSLKRFITSNGTWLLANNYNMDASYGDEAIGIDTASIEYCTLSENGINNDTQLILDYDKTNPKIMKDLVFTQSGWRVWHEARHARLAGVTSYA